PPGKTKNYRRRRFRKFRIGAAILLFVPVLALHAASLFFSLHDRGMKAFEPHTVTDSSGHVIRYYELEQPGAEWNIIFIHGTPATAGAFVEQLRRPFPHANLLAMDRPGFGRSGPGLRRPSVDDQAAAVGAVLAQAPGIRTLLVGHSYG